MSPKARKRMGIAVVAVLALVTLLLSSLFRSVPNVGNEEVIPPDEESKIAGIVSSSVRLSEYYRQPNEIHRRDVHAKAHGCVKATFTVPVLDPKYRQGILAQPGEYKAWIRFSSGTRVQSDSVKDARGMAVKVMGVPGEKLLPDEKDAQTQDFVMINSRAFFIRTADEYAEFAGRISRGDRFGYFFGGSYFRPWNWRLRELMMGLKTLKEPPASPLRAEYGSLSAYKLGPTQNIKFGAHPCEGKPRGGAPGQGPNALREALKADLTAGPGCFDFVVQLQRADKYMPVEDATVEWTEKDAPFVKVARLEIPPQAFDDAAQDQFCEALSFTPWHALPAHRPIGVMNRLRKAVYLGVSRYRNTKNQVPLAEPRGWCLDLTGKTCHGL